MHHNRKKQISIPSPKRTDLHKLPLSALKTMLNQNTNTIRNQKFLDCLEDKGRKLLNLNKQLLDIINEKEMVEHLNELKVIDEKRQATNNTIQCTGKLKYLDINEAISILDDKRKLEQEREYKRNQEKATTMMQDVSLDENHHHGINRDVLKFNQCSDDDSEEEEEEEEDSDEPDGFFEGCRINEYGREE